MSTITLSLTTRFVWVNNETHIDSLGNFILHYTVNVKQTRLIIYIYTARVFTVHYIDLVYTPVIVQCSNYCIAVIVFCSQYSRKQFSLWGWQCAEVDTRTPSHVVFSMVDVNSVCPVLMTYPFLIGQWMVSGALKVSSSHPAGHPFGQFVAPLHPTILYYDTTDIIHIISKVLLAAPLGADAVRQWNVMLNVIRWIKCSGFFFRAVNRI